MVKTLIPLAQNDSEKCLEQCKLLDDRLGCNTLIKSMVAVAMGAVDTQKSLAYRIRNLEVGLKRLDKLSIPSTLQDEVDKFKNSGATKLKELNDKIKGRWISTECGYQASEA